MSEPTAVPLYNANDGLTGRDGGPYLDLEIAKAEETRRAQVEGREPDYEAFAGSSAGIRLVTAQQLVTVEGVANIPSQSDNPAAANAQAVAVEAIAADDDSPLVAVSEIPAEAFPEVSEEADLSATSWLAGEYNPDTAEEVDEGPKETSTEDSSVDDDEDDDF